MSIHEVKLRGHQTVAEGTMAFRLSKPDGFVFKAGQAIRLELVDPPADAGQGSRTLSLVSAPFEQELMVATRMRDSGFKRTLKTLPGGADIRIDGPFGDLTLGDTGQPAVFIAGGIGITPFMSMLRQSARDGMPHRIVLMYSNRRAQDSAFLEELQEIARANANFTLVTTMTEAGGSFVDAAMIAGATKGLRAPIFYVAGPPAMVEAMKSVLEKAGVEDTDVRSEEFFGYETAPAKDEVPRAEAA